MHWHMHNHIVIDELIFLGDHHIAIQGKETSKFLGFKDIDLLKRALFTQ